VQRLDAGLAASGVTEGLWLQRMRSQTEPVNHRASDVMYNQYLASDAAVGADL